MVDESQCLLLTASKKEREIKARFLTIDIINHWNKLAEITESCPFAFRSQIKGWSTLLLLLFSQGDWGSEARPTSYDDLPSAQIAPIYLLLFFK